jgi:hypothetical protein
MRRSCLLLVLLTGCASARHDPFEYATSGAGADSLEGAQKYPGHVGGGNGVNAGTVGCAGPRYVGFMPSTPGDFHLELSMQVAEHLSPVLIEILSKEGAVLHTQKARVGAQSPDTDAVDVESPYEELGVSEDAARITTYVLRLTQEGTPCEPLKFMMHFPEPPLPY